MATNFSSAILDTNVQQALVALDAQMDAVEGKVAVTQAASVAADVAALRTDFNALLTKLKNAGLMAST